MDDTKVAYDRDIDYSATRSLRQAREEDMKRKAQMECNQAAAQGGPAYDQASTGTSRAEITLDNVDEVFDYQPWGRHQVECGNAVREALVGAVKAILRFVPPGPDRAVAIRKIREARMDANSAITHYGRF